jgi:hypothetical protein
VQECALTNASAHTWMPAALTTVQMQKVRHSSWFTKKQPQVDVMLLSSGQISIKNCPSPSPPKKKSCNPTYEVTIFTFDRNRSREFEMRQKKKFGKRKYNIGHHTWDQRVLGGTEINNGQTFLRATHYKNMPTMLWIIQAPDCLTTYKLEEYLHIPKHSIWFVDEKTCIHSMT